MNIKLKSKQMSVLVNIVTLVLFFLIISLSLNTFGLKIQEYEFITMYTDKLVGVGISLVMLKVFLMGINYINRSYISQTLGINYQVVSFIKVIAYIVFILAALENFGYNLTSILALGGVGGLIIGFAAKDIIANLFGYVTVMLDRPFKTGDTIVCNSHSINGVIHKIGFRTTEIMGLDKRPLYVPNSLWVTSTIINASRKTNREIDFKVPLLSTNEILINKICIKTKEYIFAIAEIDTKMGVDVFISEISNEGVLLRVLAYTKNISLSNFFKVKNLINSNLIFLLNKNDIELNIIKS